MHHPDVATRAQRAPGPRAGRLTSSDWLAFAGPGDGWARTVDRLEGAAEDRIVRAIDDAIGGIALEAVDPAWIDFLKTHMPVAAFAFQAAGEVLEHAADEAPWGSVGQGLSLHSSMLQRQAQAIVLYAMDMEPWFGDMPMEAARERWASDPRWAPVRTLLADARPLDWGTALVVVQLCFEPLIGQFLRREIAMGRGSDHGDPVTAVVAEAGQMEWALAREWCLSLIRYALSDASHGEDNLDLLGGRIADWQDPAIAATRTLSTIAQSLPHPAPEGVPLSRVLGDHVQLLGEAGLPSPLTGGTSSSTRSTPS